MLPACVQYAWQHASRQYLYTILAYAIDRRTGEPTLIQCIDTRGMHSHTFSIDPNGRMLIAANKSPLLVKDGSTVRTVPASLDVFRIGTDGKLDYVRKYDVKVRTGSMFWTGLAVLAT